MVVKWLPVALLREDNEMWLQSGLEAVLALKTLHDAWSAYQRVRLGKASGISAAQAVRAGVAAWITADNPWLLVSTVWFTILSTIQEWSLWKQGWMQHWQGVCAVEDIEARYKGMTVKLKCSDGMIREFLFDTGAAASLIPSKLFRLVCRKVGLRPSRLTLRTADGSTMVAVGTSEVHLRLPDQPMTSKPLISHRFEVLPDGGMPNHLQIAGVDSVFGTSCRLW